MPFRYYLYFIWVPRHFPKSDHNYQQMSSKVAGTSIPMNLLILR